jgi:hypothetical protein
VDPITIAALLGLGGKALDAGVGAWKAWLEKGCGGVSIASDGSQYSLPVGGRALREPRLLGWGEPVLFEGFFVPADPWAEAYLLPEQPVLLVIESQDQSSSLDSMVAIASLDSRFEGSLFPGNYLLGAFVFLEDDPDDWQDVDGGALLDFSVMAGEPPFRLQVAIEAIPEPAEILGAGETVLYGSGNLRAEGQDHYDVVFARDVTYRVYVAPSNERADFDLYVYDESEHLVAQDADPDSDALCTVTPRWTGPFTIVVECHSGDSPYVISVQG